MKKILLLMSMLLISVLIFSQTVTWKDNIYNPDNFIYADHIWSDCLQEQVNMIDNLIYIPCKIGEENNRIQVFYGDIALMQMGFLVRFVDTLEEESLNVLAIYYPYFEHIKFCYGDYTKEEFEEKIKYMEGYAFWD